MKFKIYNLKNKKKICIFTNKKFIINNKKINT